MCFIKSSSVTMRAHLYETITYRQNPVMVLTPGVILFWLFLTAGMKTLRKF